MIIKSLDPRVSRENIEMEEDFNELKGLDHWPTYEVFHQKKRGTHHSHVGTVHAPNAEMAVLFGKEQYARRGTCVNLWVVKTENIYTTEYEDSDIFSTTEEKIHRDPGSYKVMDKIKAYKKRQA
jgi:ring-1,2-phenylacetyl-CoA epoxidase subunit PaaB